MFIRWKRHERKKQHTGWTAAQRAYVVRSERVNGKPRQKVIAYLGNIHTRADGSTAPLSADHFLNHAASKLASIPGADVPALMRQIEQRIPRPAPDVLENDKRAAEAWLAGLKALLQGRPRRPRRKKKDRQFVPNPGTILRSAHKSHAVVKNIGTTPEHVRTL